MEKVHTRLEDRMILMCSWYVRIHQRTAFGVSATSETKNEYDIPSYSLTENFQL